MIDAKVIADSVSPDGVRLTTIQARIHRFILPEITRHRVFSFSVGSSRAVPTKKIIEQVANDPAMPVFWGKNQPGMVADEEQSRLVYMPDHAVDDHWAFLPDEAWKHAADAAVDIAQAYNASGYHKQIVNRLLEPFQWCDLIMTGTEWDNFFKLRIDYAAQPEIREAAIKIRDAMEGSVPNLLMPNEWHLPYVVGNDNLNFVMSKYLNEETMLQDKTQCSAARVARVSYLNHDQTNPNVEKDLKTASRLLEDGHWSPFEHQATPMKATRPFDARLSPIDTGTTHVHVNGDAWSGNLRGWVQYRQLLEE